MSTQTPTYVVTGAAGFVGSNLCAELTNRDGGAHILAIDPFISGSFANLVEAYARAKLGPFTGEILPASVEEIDFAELIADRRPAAIFHLGAITDTTFEDERVMLEVNSDSFGPMLAASVAAGVPLVYASSAATYGSPPQADTMVPFPIEAAGNPNNVYGFSKWMMEVEHRRVARLHPDAHVVGLRYFNVFGPGEARKGRMASMVHQLSLQVLDGERPRLFTGGEQARDQVWVGDVVSCTLAAAGLGERLATEIKPGVYNLGSGQVTTFNQIADAIRDGMGLSAEERPTEYFEMPEHVRAFYQDYTCADMSETESGLGWAPETDPIEQMRTYASMLEADAAERMPA
ncbi:MAG: NAD-dependent epimerase/dehydratase family protein [Planctomycetota bacterium]